MKSAAVMLLLLSLLSPGCYRAELKTLLLPIPGAQGNARELNAIRTYLLGEESQLREGLFFYTGISVRPEDSALEITYNREVLADMNLIHKVNQLGYRVGDLPGDPEKRAAFLNDRTP